MREKHFLAIFIIIIAILGAVLVFSINSPINDLNKTTDSSNITNSTVKNSSIENNTIKNSSLNQSDLKIDKDVELTVTAEQSFPVEKIVEEIKTHPSFEGYDEDTVKWLENYNDSVIFTSKDKFVVMSQMDASKLPTSFVNDAFIYDDFRCDIIEVHSLGDNLKDVVYVKNVEFESQWVKPMTL